MTTGVSFKAVSRPARNEAVQLCLEIWKEEYEKFRARGESDYNSSQAAHLAYRDAMPEPSSFQDIKDFIACISRGILIKAIDEYEASRLLSAARIASQAFASAEKAVLKAVAQLQSGAAA